MDKMIKTIYDLLHEKGLGYIHDSKLGTGYKVNLWQYAKWKAGYFERNM